MKLEKIWNKLEDEEPLNTREEKRFSDGLEKGIDRLERIKEESARSEN